MLAGCLHWAVERELVRKALGRSCADGHRWCLASLEEGRRFGAHGEANTRAVVDCWEDERCVSEMHPSLLEHRPGEPSFPGKALCGQLPERSQKSQFQG